MIEKVSAAGWMWFHDCIFASSWMFWINAMYPNYQPMEKYVFFPENGATFLKEEEKVVMEVAW